MHSYCTICSHFAVSYVLHCDATELLTILNYREMAVTAAAQWGSSEWEALGCVGCGRSGRFNRNIQQSKYYCLYFVLRIFNIISIILIDLCMHCTDVMSQVLRGHRVVRPSDALGLPRLTAWQVVLHSVLLRTPEHTSLETAVLR